MATTIGRNSTADIKISAAGGGAQTSYRGQFREFSMRCVIPQVDTSTFASEPNTEYEAGETIFVATFAGKLQFGTGAVGAMMPPPQLCDCTWQYHTGCTVSGKFNFDDTLATRVTNVNATLAGTARGTGIIGIAWA